MADGGHRRARVLILGGTGFIGRHLVAYLVSHDLVSKVRVADKVPPQMAWLNCQHKEVFANPLVEFKHSSLINPASVKNAFTDPEGEFDYVINLAAETKYGQTDPVYQEGINRLSTNCAAEAMDHKVKLYIEFSSGQMYSSDKKPCREDGKCEPWTHLAKHKLEVEHQLENFKDLNYIIVRPAIVYGPGDRQGLTPRLIIGAIYKYIRQKMKMLWTKDLKMNTVHVQDVCQAVWHLCNHGSPGQVYNIVDSSDTTQGKVCHLVAELFNVQYDFVGSMFSNIARVNMTSVVEEINDKHMTPWAEACQTDNVSNTPLDPFIDEELLYNKHLYLDGKKLLETGFIYQIPAPRLEHLREMLEDYISLGLFPKTLLKQEISSKGDNSSDIGDKDE
ncbi:dTDP-D-glucose 4,6-dehydratase-like isoform X2 [Mizuhopecten yessoensis]|uniref:dTDP-D-glucose 4,6-dehydratase n=1 Tax=Mizuhopecten yessoensis TaxID=6573 RepID=A0A210QMK7_MIZYE|nr:dTDP-D-glucose 4,6-dehydratase-like isoform X2 [Mizuhopecten yessoensis]OWF49963.1 dTDP-D-glucose 4,6-dehydratase [Mizuhopecten yessoensis]